MTARPRPLAFDPAHLASLALGADVTPREAELYGRYLRALALLCEC